MSNPRRLSEMVSIRGRFHRSVNLVRDWQADLDLSEYVVTPTVRDLAVRVAGELERNRGTRAWSVTGPYGSGKSAFALFLLDVLCQRRPHHSSGVGIRKKSSLGGRTFLPVLLVGERAPLGITVLNALAAAFAEVDRPFAQMVRRRKKTSSAGASVVEFVLEAGRRARAKGRTGLVLVIDELGKFLEFAAQKPENDDVYLLQQIAEAVAGSETPILFVTILHTGFADYLPANDEVRRGEWQKVQGRFKDIPFHMPTEQVLALVAHAIQRRVPAKLSEQWKDSAARIVDSPVLTEAGQRLPISRVIPDCVPLHPITSLLLWSVFHSKVAQNERSLFAFLTSHEPFGFQDFLRRSIWPSAATPLFRAPGLYDYVRSALGLAVFRGIDGRKWSVIEHGLARIPSDSEELLRDVVKVVGLLSLYGSVVGLRADSDTIAAALDVKAKRVRQALAELMDRSILVHRRHSDSYALWEGSDVDLEAALAEAHCHIAGEDLAARLRRALDLRPLVARAHYIERGTLRVFDVDVIAADGKAVERASANRTPGNGLVLFLVETGNEADLDPVALAQRLTAKLDDPLTILAIPSAFVGIGDALREFEAWKWVSRNVHELQGDPVARQEVRSRMIEAQDRLDRLAGRIFGLAGQAFDPGASVWIHCGKEHPVSSARHFQHWLSTLCNRAFSGAPTFHNELLNRADLSSAASAARRTLVERMLQYEHVERLGIEGMPPEAAMYESMLRSGGFHQERDGAWRFDSPSKRWRPVWDEIQSFFAASTATKRPVADLFTRLKAPPYGLRDGPLPVLLTAALLARRDQIALYEEGVFVPAITIEVLERLIRRPETFELKSHRLSTAQQRLLATLDRLSARHLGTGRRLRGEARLLPVVKSLVVFVAQLNPYTRQTRRVEPVEAVEVRRLLLEATDPHDLLFQQLPSVFGLTLKATADAQKFGKRLGEAVRGLARAYPRLLDEIEEQLRTVFDLTGSAEVALHQLRQRAAPLVDFATEQRLQLFVRQAARESIDRDWREDIGRIINDGLPPTHWRDADVTGFQVKLQELASQFTRLEEIIVEKQKTKAARVFRVAVLDGMHQERRMVIPISTFLEKDVARLAERVVHALGNGTAQNGSHRAARLAALAKVTMNLLDDESHVDLTGRHGDD